MKCERQLFGIFTVCGSVLLLPNVTNDWGRPKEWDRTKHIKNKSGSEFEVTDEFAMHNDAVQMSE